MAVSDYPKTAQGKAVPANAEDLRKDAEGITNPNLHRRIDNEVTPVAPGEVEPDSYEVSVSVVNSYRTVKRNTYTENPVEGEPESEIP